MRLALSNAIFAARNAVWSPSRLSSLALWLRGDDVATSGSAVTQWNDKSGNGKHFTQGTAAAQPSVTTLGGKAALLFDGTDDFLTNTAWGSVHMRTIAFVANCDATSPAIGALIGYAGTYGVQIDGTTPRTYLADGVGAGSGSSANTTTSASANRVVLFQYETSLSTQNTRVYQDGAQQEFHSAAGADVTAPAANMRVGYRDDGVAARKFKGTIAEIVVCSAVLSADERVELTTYLGGRYGITVA